MAERDEVRMRGVGRAVAWAVMLGGLVIAVAIGLATYSLLWGLFTLGCYYTVVWVLTPFVRKLAARRATQP